MRDLNILKEIDFSKIQISAQSKAVDVALLNMVEDLIMENEKLTIQIQELKDEIDRLKGEKGRPIFRSNQESDPKRREKGNKPRNKNHKKGGKRGTIKIDREIVCKVDRMILPPDAEFKGYEEHMQQDLEVKVVNTLYKLEIYYSRSNKRTYRANIAESGKGMYGSGVKGWLSLLNRFCDTTQSRLKELFASLGISISTGTINNYLLEPQEWVLEEQNEILKAGISSGSYGQIDGTKSVERGKSKATQIICGELFTTFYTKPNKKRLSIIEALLGIVEGQSVMKYGYNEVTKELLACSSVSLANRNTLEQIFGNKQEAGVFEWLGEKDAFEQRMQDLAPQIMSKKNMYERVVESFALGYYYSQDEFPVIDFLVSDDAPEYRKLSKVLHSLCWIHDARYYKKLVPRIERHRTILTEVMDQYWRFYNLLLAYKGASKKEQKYQYEIIKEEFDHIFSQKTQYFQVNQCLERTLKNKEKLLAVLDNPALPLHNNAAELGARRIVRKRDISLHSWSAKGTIVRDAFMSVIQTCLKLGVSPFNYIMDRIKGEYAMPALSSLIYQTNP